VFALKGFTIKTEDGKYFITPTGHTKWAGPYKSLHHATTAIASKLSHEFMRRNDRLQKAKEARP
jgi:hypothetical protein